VAITPVLLHSKLDKLEAMATPDNFGNTPLHLAVMTNQLDLVAYFLQQGADPRQLNEDGESAFDIAYKRLGVVAKPMLQQLLAPPSLDNPALRAAIREMASRAAQAAATSKVVSDITTVVDRDWVTIDPTIVPSQAEVAEEEARRQRAANSRSGTADRILAGSRYTSTATLLAVIAPVTFLLTAQLPASPFYRLAPQRPTLQRLARVGARAIHVARALKLRRQGRGTYRG